MSMIVLQITSKAGVKGFLPLSSIQVVFERKEGGCVVNFQDSTEMTVKESLDDLLRQIPDPHP